MTDINITNNSGGTVNIYQSQNPDGIITPVTPNTDLKLAGTGSGLVSAMDSGFTNSIKFKPMGAAGTSLTLVSQQTSNNTLIFPNLEEPAEVLLNKGNQTVEGHKVFTNGISASHIKLDNTIITAESLRANPAMCGPVKKQLYIPHTMAQTTGFWNVSGIWATEREPREGESRIFIGLSIPTSVNGESTLIESVMFDYEVAEEDLTGAYYCVHTTAGWTVSSGLPGDIGNHKHTDQVSGKIQSHDIAFVEMIFNTGSKTVLRFKGIMVNYTENYREL